MIFNKVIWIVMKYGTKGKEKSVKGVLGMKNGLYIMI